MGETKAGCDGGAQGRAAGEVAKQCSEHPTYLDPARSLAWLLTRRELCCKLQACCTSPLPFFP